VRFLQQVHQQPAYKYYAAAPDYAEHHYSGAPQPAYRHTQPPLVYATAQHGYAGGLHGDGYDYYPGYAQPQPQQSAGPPEAAQR